MSKPKKTISAGEFKVHCLRIMEEVRRSRRPVLVTKRGAPLVQLIPTDESPQPLFGCMKDSLQKSEDLVEPTDVVWEAERE